MVTKQTEPDLGSRNDEDLRQRKRVQWRKVGAFVVIAVLVIAAGAACSPANQDATTEGAGQPGQAPTTTGTASTTTFTSGVVGYLDLTTGETSTTEITPHNSAIDVSPDGKRITYVADGVVNVADLDGSNVEALEETYGSPTGPQWSPDGSSIVYQGEPGGSSIGDLFIVDVGSGKVRPITDLQGLEAAELSYLSPTFDPTRRHGPVQHAPPREDRGSTVCGPCP